MKLNTEKSLDLTTIGEDPSKSDKKSNKTLDFSANIKSFFSYVYLTQDNLAISMSIKSFPGAKQDKKKASRWKYARNLGSQRHRVKIPRRTFSFKLETWLFPVYFQFVYTKNFRMNITLLLRVSCYYYLSIRYNYLLLCNRISRI